MLNHGELMMNNIKLRESRAFIYACLLSLLIPCSVYALTLDDALNASLDHES
jgi:hypothetical protein